MKLISMTDFVLEQTELLYEKNQSKLIHNIVYYAQFLKQPLKLEMFVPCDDEGNVLKRPNETDIEWFNNQIYGDFSQRYTAIFNYQQAKEKVLFEGFSYNSEDATIERVEKDGGIWSIDIDNLVKYTIEDMIQCELKLTQISTKQFL